MSFFQKYIYRNYLHKLTLESKRSMEAALYKNDEFFQNRLKAAIANVTCNDLHGLRNNINGHDEDLNILDKNIQNLVTAIKDKFYKTTMTLHNHHLAIKVLTKPLTAYMEVLRKVKGFYNTCGTAFKDFLSTLCIITCKTDTSNNRCSHMWKIP